MDPHNFFANFVNFSAFCVIILFTCLAREAPIQFISQNFPVERTLITTRRRCHLHAFGQCNSLRNVKDFAFSTITDSNKVEFVSRKRKTPKLLSFRGMMSASDTGNLDPVHIGSSPAALIQAAKSSNEVLQATAGIPLPGEEKFHYHLQLHHQRKRIVYIDLLIPSLTNIYVSFSGHINICAQEAI